MTPCTFSCLLTVCHHPPAAVEVQQILASETVVWRRGILVVPDAIHEVGSLATCVLCCLVNTMGPPRVGEPASERCLQVLVEKLASADLALNAKPWLRS